MLRNLTFGLLILLTADHATAALQSVTPTKANGDFIPGTGIPANDFTVTTASGVSVALKARAREGGNPLSIVGSTYHVLPGLAPSSSNPWWNFDFQYSPGTTGNSPSETTLTLEVDFDPGVGSEDFRTISQIISGGGPSWDDGDSFLSNPGSNAWSDNAVPFVVSNSWRYNFAFWDTLPGGPTNYDPNATGEYLIRLTAVHDTGSVSTEILVNVAPLSAPVPEPGSIVLVLGLAACGLPAVLRRRRVVA